MVSSDSRGADNNRRKKQNEDRNVKKQFKILVPFHF